MGKKLRNTSPTRIQQGWHGPVILFILCVLCVFSRFLWCLSPFVQCSVFLLCSPQQPEFPSTPVLYLFNEPRPDTWVLPSMLSFQSCAISPSLALPSSQPPTSSPKVSIFDKLGMRIKNLLFLTYRSFKVSLNLIFPPREWWELQMDYVEWMTLNMSKQFHF